MQAANRQKLERRLQEIQDEFALECISFAGAVAFFDTDETCIATANITLNGKNCVGTAETKLILLRTLMKSIAP